MMKNVLRTIFIVYTCIVSVNIFIQKCIMAKFGVCVLNAEALAAHEVVSAVACIVDKGDCCFYDSYVLLDYDEREVNN